MLALIAAVLLALDAFGVRFDQVSIFKLALGFWALSFAVGWTIPIPWRRS